MLRKASALGSNKSEAHNVYVCLVEVGEHLSQDLRLDEKSSNHSVSRSRIGH